MSADLTIDNLLAAIRHFLEVAATSSAPGCGVEDDCGLPSCELVLVGTPADDTMKRLMEMFDGEFRIVVRELPKEMDEIATLAAEILTEHGGACIWHPEDQL